MKIMNLQRRRGTVNKIAGLSLIFKRLVIWSFNKGVRICELCKRDKQKNECGRLIAADDLRR